MDKNWNSDGERQHFRDIWEYRSPGHKRMHTQQIWDERADEWEKELTEDAAKIDATRQRVEASAAFLRHKGLLSAEQDVIDIGCGPGRFVAEFARTCHHAVGSDISGRMLEHGESYARAQGILNTGYVRADFNTADIDKLGWRERFDLVFTHTTPAVGGKGNLEKLMAMSRGWCFNGCFVHSGDALVDGFLQEELGLGPRNKVGGHWHWFYGLFNLLLLEGYFPEVTYYDEHRRERLAVTPETAQRLCRGLMLPDGQQGEGLEKAMYEYLLRRADADGMVERDDICTYGWVLWDVRRRVSR